MMNYWWKIIKFGIKLAIQKDLTVNLFTTKKKLRTKIKSYEGKIISSFPGDKIPKQMRMCLLINNIDWFSF